LLIESSRTYGRGILRGIARYAHVQGPWSFLSLERELHSGIPSVLEHWKPDGIIARIEDRLMGRRLLRLGCPVVDVLGQMRIDGIPSLDTDAKAVARLAAEFFRRAGFQHFAFVGYPGIPFSDRRAAALREILVERGQILHEGRTLLPEQAGGSIQEVERAGITAERRIVQWLRRQPHPLAVLACNDVCAQQVLNACREFGLRVPEQIAVMGVDNDDVLCNLCDPSLSSIEPDTERLGEEAAAALERLMSGEKPVPSLRLIAPVRLVERASTDTVAIEDPITVAALRYIRDHVGEGIAVKDVLTHLGRSRSDLEKRFRQHLQTSVRSEILRRRMDRVCRLLQETDAGLDKVASLAGFATAAHLCRLFQQRFGQTPTAFRNASAKSGQ
jgi:LacI family transcriptional regulator